MFEDVGFFFNYSISIARYQSTETVRFGQSGTDSKLDRMPTRLKAYLVDSEWQEFREQRDALEEQCMGYEIRADALLFGEYFCKCDAIFSTYKRG
ncbi:hypothetical protein [Cyclobacterium xiamenense]|uniref:hypothetical protein n=1 Tax=Cyclobacterium xiamenense TaxID=1297121 RepID=UPI0035CF39AC